MSQTEASSLSGVSAQVDTASYSSSSLYHQMESTEAETLQSDMQAVGVAFSLS